MLLVLLLLTFWEIQLFDLWKNGNGRPKRLSKNLPALLKLIKITLNNFLFV